MLNSKFFILLNSFITKDRLLIILILWANAFSTLAFEWLIITSNLLRVVITAYLLEVLLFEKLYYFLSLAITNLIISISSAKREQSWAKPSILLFVSLCLVDTLLTMHYFLWVLWNASVSRLIWVDDLRWLVLLLVSLIFISP